MKEMENDKYFTPDIEDISTGYECEQLINQVWTKEIFAKGSYLPENSDLLHWAHTCIINKNLRVPYLTKEQIEAEGWKETSKYRYEKIDSNITSYYGDDCYLWIMHPAITVLGERYLASSFKGECKDINTFRKIIKLLGI